MESQISAIVCPNCGANTTNHQNCDFCGSLLVRFVGTEVNLDQTSYLSNDFCLPGLIDALKENIRLQKEYPDETVATDIVNPFNDDGAIVNYLCFVMKSSRMENIKGEHIFKDAKPLSIAVGFAFSQYTDKDYAPEFNKIRRERLDAFTKLPSSQLFKKEIGFGDDNDGYQQKVYSYCIDFGEDVEGAARLISEIAVKVYGCEPYRALDYYTNWGEAIYENRDLLEGWEPSRSSTETSSTERSSTESSSGSEGGCYVATCVYGSYDCPEVWTLRRYRDYTLDESWLGRLSVKIYYAVSPIMVRWFGKTTWFKKMWKPFLDKMVANLQAKGVEDTPYVDKY